MTVTEIRNRRADTEAALSTLAEKVAAAIDDSLAIIHLETARAMCNESGVHRFQELLLSTEDQFREAQTRRRRAGTALGEVESEHNAAVTEAMWLLDAKHFVTRSNKQWLAVDAHGNPIPEDDQKSFDADARKAWLNHHVRKDPTVVDTAKRLSEARELVAQADDDIKAISKAASNYEHLLDSARVELEVLSRSIHASTNGAAR